MSQVKIQHCNIFQNSLFSRIIHQQQRTGRSAPTHFPSVWSVSRVLYLADARLSTYNLRISDLSRSLSLARQRTHRWWTLTWFEHVTLYLQSTSDLSRSLSLSRALDNCGSTFLNKYLLYSANKSYYWRQYLLSWNQYNCVEKTRIYLRGIYFFMYYFPGYYQEQLCSLDGEYKVLTFFLSPTVH